MPSVFKSHIPTSVFLIIIVTSKITEITITTKIRGRWGECFALVWGFGRSFGFF